MAQVGPAQVGSGALAVRLEAAAVDDGDAIVVGLDDGAGQQQGEGQEREQWLHGG
ncbi:hypothetical protein D3C85_1715250 [compost metagenome]